MHVTALNDFKKISLENKMISKLEREIFSLNSALELFKEKHASLVNEILCI